MIFLGSLLIDIKAPHSKSKILAWSPNQIFFSGETCDYPWVKFISLGKNYLWQEAVIKPWRKWPFIGVVCHGAEMDLGENGPQNIATGRADFLLNILYSIAGSDTLFQFQLLSREMTLNRCQDELWFIPTRHNVYWRALINWIPRLLAWSEEILCWNN